MGQIRVEEKYIEIELTDYDLRAALDDQEQYKMLMAALGLYKLKKIAPHHYNNINKNMLKSSAVPEGYQYRFVRNGFTKEEAFREEAL